MRRTLAMLLALSGVVPAHAADPTPGVITVAAFLYLPGDTEVPELPLVVEQGASLTFTSADTVGGFHSIVSEDLRADATPLFWAGQIGPGQVSEVNGVPGLEPGTYRFYCSNHPDMNGLLAVAPA